MLILSRMYIEKKESLRNPFTKFASFSHTDFFRRLSLFEVHY
jgi:hypothetical protein